MDMHDYEGRAARLQMIRAMSDAEYTEWNREWKEAKDAQWERNQDEADTWRSKPSKDTYRHGINHTRNKELLEKIRLINQSNSNGGKNVTP